MINTRATNQTLLTTLHVDRDPGPRPQLLPVQVSAAHYLAAVATVAAASFRIASSRMQRAGMNSQLCTCVFVVTAVALVCLVSSLDLGIAAFSTLLLPWLPPA